MIFMQDDILDSENEQNQFKVREVPLNIYEYFDASMNNTESRLKSYYDCLLVPCKAKVLHVTSSLEIVA